MKTRLLLLLFPLWLLATVSPAHAGEVYQWFDSTGGIHFTDDYYATPVALRGTPDLIVRTDLGRQQFVEPQTVSGTAVQQRWVTNTENQGQSSRYADLNSDNFEPAQNVIVVVNDSLPTNPCHHGCRVRFKPDFNDRQYIHPSVFNAPARQYIHRGPLRSGRR
jgi:Domain of unknown function (DUF4124)